MIMCFYFFHFVYMVDYAGGISHTEPLLYSWHDVYLIMVDDYMFLDMVCKHFI